MPGQDAEFTAYVRRSRARLLRAGYLLCGSWDLAEDVTQTTLAKLYLAWPRIEPERGPDGYAYRILARSMVDEHRRPWRRELLDAMPDDRADTSPDEDDDARTGLRDAVWQLPLRQRQVVVLRHYTGLSVDETAAALGISAGSVKSHCSRGLHRLDELLRPDPTKVSPQ